MRILTLLAGENSRSAATALTREIRRFNAEIDFRLRFLHVEIEEAHVAVSGSQDAVQSDDADAPTRTIELVAGGALEYAAQLALLFASERPDAVVVIGAGPLRDAAIAAARVQNTKLATFGEVEGSSDVDLLELGEEPGVAVERLTGVAREIR